MKSVFTMILAGACVAVAATAVAQQSQPAATAQTAGAAYAEGEVRKVDKSAGKITLKHGEIKTLDMPPMTMVFSVKDASVLDGVKVGDKVRFRAANQDGKFTVTEIAPN